MKNFSFASSLLVFSLLAITFSNCRNRPEIVDPSNILGKWKVMSYSIDSEEQIGTTYNEVTINFGEISDGVGPFAKITIDTNGSSLSQGGEFSIGADLLQVYITINGTTTEYAINFDTDNLIMQGIDEDNRTIEYHCDKAE